MHRPQLSTILPVLSLDTPTSAKRPPCLPGGTRGERGGIGIRSCIKAPGRSQRHGTPASAGRTAETGQGSSIVAEHPRISGEDPDQDPAVVQAIGTLPRTRGCSDVPGTLAMPAPVLPADAGVFR
ncbi:hypothetical protein GCM10010503_37640 [Streptomyces lucensis JCM 4490]|uniref:Uncharacterized protein n=1 Tax=Streptomyces lucensis JCM 4490 TaxID=1306176 RepID=A0A918J7U5_9ACTN|nr:hypothetical protein GCM10010503_37640 [Streptomyces lucensis JCM 4490]